MKFNIPYRVRLFLTEIEKKHEYSTRCPHGGVMYHRTWMPKTQLKAVSEGYIKKCTECSSSNTHGYNYYFINQSDKG